MMLLRDYLIGIAGSMTAAAIVAAIAYTAYRYVNRNSTRLIRALTLRGGIWYTAWQPAGEGFPPWHVERIRLKSIFPRTVVTVRTYTTNEEETPFVWSGQLQSLNDARTLFGPWRSWKMPFYSGIFYLQVKQSDLLSGHFTSWTSESKPWIGRCMVAKTKEKLTTELRAEITDPATYERFASLLDGL